MKLADPDDADIAVMPLEKTDLGTVKAATVNKEVDKRLGVHIM
jgi:hypothetical protein